MAGTPVIWARGLGILLACAGVAATPSAARLSVARAPSFGVPRSYSIGSYETQISPVSVAVGDLNGDGKADLATAHDPSTVSVFLNEGDGSFGFRRDYRTGLSPSALEIGDLNGDGSLDLATADSQAGTITVLLNSGDGRFHAVGDYIAGRFPNSIGIGDLDGDGDVDLATTNQTNLFVFSNWGDGSFPSRRGYATGKRPTSIAIGDLNGDGKLDVSTGNLGQTVSVLLNRGDGGLRAKRDYRTGKSHDSIAIGDLNADGKLDLVAGGATVSVLLNERDGTFRAATNLGGSGHVAIGDLNGDGKPELATAHPGVDYNGTGIVSVLVNRGNGRFRASVDYATPAAPSRLAIGDLNGDGKLDLATASPVTHTVSVHRNRPGLCTVQNVASFPTYVDASVKIVPGKTVSVATRMLARANCRAGKIRRAYSKTVGRGRVISQKPKFGAVLAGGGKVDLVVSRGRQAPGR